GGTPPAFGAYISRLDRHSLRVKPSLPDADPARSDEQTDDDQNDAGEGGAAEERHDPGDHQDHGEDPQKRGGPTAQRRDHPKHPSSLRFEPTNVISVRTYQRHLTRTAGSGTTR